MHLLALDALKRLPEPERRKEVLLGVIRAYRLLPLTADLLKELGKEHGWFGRNVFPEEHQALPPKQFEEVLKAALDDLRAQAEESALLTRRPLDESLYFWRAAAGNDEPKAYLQQMLGDGEGFTNLLGALVGEDAARQIRKG